MRAVADCPHYVLTRQSPLASGEDAISTDDLDGDAEIADGVRVIVTPGHTPGHQSVLVETADGRYCVTGDAVMQYENLEKRIPPGFHTSARPLPVRGWAAREEVRRQGG